MREHRRAFAREDALKKKHETFSALLRSAQIA
jgi:hypothetical protein